MKLLIPASAKEECILSIRIYKISENMVDDEGLRTYVDLNEFNQVTIKIADIVCLSKMYNVNFVHDDGVSVEVAPNGVTSIMTAFDTMYITPESYEGLYDIIYKEDVIQYKLDN